LTKDFPDPIVEFPSLDEEETVIGVHSSGIFLEEGSNTSGGRYYCSNCKKKIHCYVKVDRETNEAKIHNTCKDKICECKCKTHYACKICGYLHPYGQKCNKPENIMPRDSQSAKELDELLASWSESKGK